MADAKRESWLVHHFCQGQGLANSLRMLCRNIDVELVDQFSTAAHRDKVRARLDSFDRVIVEPSVLRRDPVMAGIDPSRLVQLPTLAFHGYHPDLTLLWSEGKALSGPNGSAHSMIAYLAFETGIDERGAVALFREDVFDACGYFRQWEPGRARLLADFREYGFDLSAAFVEWSRRGPFMHSIIHPHVECLRDVAKLILARLGMEVLDTQMLPVDNLAAGEGSPVYPEIAVRLGIRGSYLFKLGKSYQVVELPQYVALAYDHYRDMPAATAHPGHVERLEQARKGFREMTG
jgi:hypothetical protein